MAREKFVDSYLEKLIKKDKEIGAYFEGADESKKEHLKDLLSESLGYAYDTHAKDYFETRGVGGSLSRILRFTGAAADAMGTYAFWSLGITGIPYTIPTAFGFKGVGLAEKSVAELIDAIHFAKTVKTGKTLEKLAEEGLILGEGIIERAAAYTPLAAGELLDLIRGRAKYDNKVTATTLYIGKEKFKQLAKGLKPSLEEGPRLIPVENYINPAYTQEKEGSAKVA